MIVSSRVEGGCPWRWVLAHDASTPTSTVRCQRRPTMAPPPPSSNWDPARFTRLMSRLPGGGAAVSRFTARSRLAELFTVITVLAPGSERQQQQGAGGHTSGEARLRRAAPSAHNVIVDSPWGSKVVAPLASPHGLAAGRSHVQGTVIVVTQSASSPRHPSRPAHQATASGTHSIVSVVCGGSKL